MNIWFSSDLHIGHNKDFLYSPRGFSSIEEMNEAIIKNFKEVIQPGDIIYILGDITLGEWGQAEPYLLQLPKCNFTIGNHDTSNRVLNYSRILHWENLGYADFIKYKKTSLLISHWPTIVTNFDKPNFWNLSGHTHSKEKFDSRYPNVYNVALDAHDNYPVNLDEIISDIRRKN